MSKTPHHHENDVKTYDILPGRKMNYFLPKRGKTK
jgi:hypothetical protein